MSTTGSKPLTKANEDWLNRKWRPMMAWMYMAICVFDFMVAPILNYVFFGHTGADFVSWKPLTMTEGGLFHLSMGAILGIAAWTRGQEKLHRASRYDSYGYEEDYPTDRASYRDRLLSRDPTRED